jgi:hypothetical protein
MMASLLVHLDLQLVQLHEQKLNHITTRSGTRTRQGIHQRQLMLQLLQRCFKLHKRSLVA